LNLKLPEDGENNEHSKSESDNQIKIITDEPSTDAPDFENYANQLSKLIVNSTPRFTVGIYGGWGTGKTSLMQMIKKSLDRPQYKDDVITVWFDAWRYENEKYMIIIPLIRSIKVEIDNRIYRALKNKKSIGSGLKRLRDGLTKTLLAMGKSTKLSSKLDFQGAGAGIELDLAEFMDILHSEGSVIIDNEEVHYRKHHISDYLADTVEDFRKERKDKRRIVIFIDDLDRCTPPKALELLESVKTFFDIEGIVYVIGIEPKSIDSIIKSKYGENTKINGMDYLQKMVQLPFQIPVWGTQDLSNTIATMISKSGISKTDFPKILDREKSIEIIMRVAQLNPRDVKRFVNSIILSLYVYKESIEDIDKIIAVQAFYFRGNEWIDFLKLLVPFWTRTSFLKYFIMLLKIHEYKSEISTLADLKKVINGGIKEFALDKSILDIFKKLISLGDNDLFDYLRIASEILIKIDKMNKYLRIEETVPLADTSEFSRDIDSEKQYRLLSDGEIIKFNEYKAKQRGNSHLPYLQLPIDVKGEGKETSINGVKLNGVNLSRSFLFGAEMAYADLSDADLSDADLSLASLNNANLSWANMKSTDLTDASLWGANLSRANLQFGKLLRTDFTQANLAHANLYIARSEGAHFDSAKLVGADLRGIFTDASFSEANLTRANLFQANLVRAGLDANLTRANLMEANMTEADLTYATLAEADLTEANLTWADLTDADLTRANLTWADLTDAALVNITSFEGLKIKGSKFDNAVIDNPDFIDYLTKEKTAENIPKCVESKSELKIKLKEKNFSDDTSDLILERTRLV
jgi:uncharacterized protein YjbI with pentapeptide repeats